ncbi:MerR family transcriptional regulator [Bdellovibrio sp. HCB337]|uniref:MerR family transcriptional regulator n=1 Tax=Bdellovibrio sp. HCB337 TaxID=3394358 RepID=UPI0039A52B9E
MNIQTVADKTNLTKRMIRHYEDLGLIQPQRGDNNYRDYSEVDINRLQCVKALRSIGFGLEDIGHILKRENTEEVLRKHLQELLLKQQEIFIYQKTNTDTIKGLLNSKDNIIESLLDRIANAHSPREDGDDSLNKLLKRSRVIHGRIEELDKIANTTKFGPDRDFKISLTLFSEFEEVFKKHTFTKASVCSCDELYTHFLLMTEGGEKFDADFHEIVWMQFATSWQKVSEVFAITFEALTNQMDSLDKLFSPLDLAISMRAENDRGERFQIVIPYSPMHTFLRRKMGVYRLE